MPNDQKSVSHAEQEVKRDRNTLSRTVGAASVRRQDAVNIVIFAIVILSFGAGLKLEGIQRFIAMDIGIVLLSIKLAYYFHNNLRMNHYMFWVHMSFEQRLLEMNAKLNRVLEELEEQKAANASSNDDSVPGS